MTSALFLGFVLLVVAVVVVLCARYLGARPASLVMIALAGWLLYVGSLGYFGVVANTAMRPPGAALILIPVAAFLIFFLFRTAGTRTRWPLAFPARVLIGTQVFRIGVELFIHQLWLDGLVPKTLTFAGANVDIYIGATAPLAAWISTRGGWGRRLALVWNWLGLLALANVVVRALLTAPGPLNLIHAEIPNRMIGTFPFVFIPGFFVPLAVTLHILATRRLGTQPGIAARQF